MIFLQGGRLAAIGFLVGLTLSMMLGQFLSWLLFGMTPFDVPTLVTVPTVLGVGTSTASWLCDTSAALRSKCLDVSA